MVELNQHFELTTIMFWVVDMPCLYQTRPRHNESDEFSIRIVIDLFTRLGRKYPARYSPLIFSAHSRGPPSAKKQSPFEAANGVTAAANGVTAATNGITAAAVMSIQYWKKLDLPIPNATSWLQVQPAGCI